MNKYIAAMALAGVCLSTTACKVKQTQDAKMPEVHATGGQMPAYDVKGPDVTVTTEPRTVDVPKVKVHTP